MIQPSFLIVGATRSGSTTLHRALGRHPDIFVSKRKELWFFNHDDEHRRGLEHYAGHFAGWNGEKAVGESTPTYLDKGSVYHGERQYGFREADDAIERIARDLPACRILVSLRDPLARIRSIYWKSQLKGLVGLRSLERLLRDEMNGRITPASTPLCLLHRNRYDVHLAHLFEHIPRERVHVMIFEEWTREPRAALAGALRFLGVDDATDVTIERDNRGDRYMQKARWRERAAHSLLSRRFAQSWPRVEALVRSELAASLVRTEALLGRDLGIWPSRRAG